MFFRVFQTDSETILQLLAGHFWFDADREVQIPGEFPIGVQSRISDVGVLVDRGGRNGCRYFREIIDWAVRRIATTRQAGCQGEQA